MKTIILTLLILSSTISLFAQSSPCDPSLWLHTYRPERLIILDSCVTITGTIEHVQREADGDKHIRIKLDPGQEKYLNVKNISSQSGCLVVEIIYANLPVLPRSLKASKGYTNKLRVPKKGEHVVVTGAWVTDTNHGWNEIHPVSVIEVR